MKEILELKNKGVGKKALIIGGGPSVKGFNLCDYIYFNTDVWVINDIHVDVKVNYNIYRDKTYKERLESQIDKVKGIQIICYSENATQHADYFYNWHHFKMCYKNTKKPIQFVHTGPDCLFICDHIMNYDKIYLIGFDYYSEGQAVHWYGNEDPKSDYYVNEKYRQMVKSALFRNGLQDYKKIGWSETIINLNPKSNLTNLTKEVLNANTMQNSTVHLGVV